MPVSRLYCVAWFYLGLCLHLYSPFSAQAQSPQRSTNPPNIVLILADDVGREALGCYGGTSYPTPRLDQLANEGMRLTHFFAAPVCHPTRVALISGRYLHHMQNPKWGYYPKGEAETQTLPHALRRAGYATAAAGKWHLAMLKDDPHHPSRMGFDEHCFFGWHEGPRYWKPLLWQNGAIREDVTHRFGPDVYVKFLLDFMQRHKEGPFFAYYPMALSHAVSDDLNPHPPHGPHGRYMSYAEMMQALDQHVGKLLDGIDQLGLRENTLFFFTSDNGTTPKNFIRHEGRRLIREPTVTSTIQGQPLEGQKGQFNDWGTRVPTLVRLPGKVAPGSTNDLLADITDLLPTLATLAGQPTLPHAVDGHSFATLFTEGTASSRPWIAPQTRSQISIRTRHWKLLDDGQLFDMRGDPFHELAIPASKDTPETAAARKKLTALLAGFPRP